MIRKSVSRVLTNQNAFKAFEAQRWCSACPAASKKQKFTAVKWEDAKPFESIPGPKPLPIVGNTWRLIGFDFLKIFKSVHGPYGDIVRMSKFFPGADSLFLYDIHDIEWLFRNEGPWPRRIDFPSSYTYRHVIRKDVYGDTYGLVNGNFEKWASFRSSVNPIMMQPRVTRQYIPQINEIADEFIEHVKRLRVKSPIGEMPANFMNELNKWAFESITAIALDTRLGVLSENPSEEAETAMKLFLEVFYLMVDLDFLPTGKWHIKYNSKTFKRYVEVEDYFTNMVLKLINEAKARINSDPNYVNKAEHDKSVFEKLIAIDEQTAMVMTMDMLSAGIDTTSKATGGTLYNLARNPKYQIMLREELKRLLPNKHTPITYEVLEQAKVLKAVIKESLRLIPVASVGVRVMNNPIVFSGYQVPAGTTVLIPHLYLSKMVNGHFDKPEEFLPDRWLRGGTGDRVNTFVSLPFGFGSRSCIGKRLANMELEIIVAKMVRNFVFEWHHPEVRCKQQVIYGISDPLKLKIIDASD